MTASRSQALIETFSESTTPRYLVADSKLYTEENAQNLAKLPFITRIPNTLTVVRQVIDQALDFDQWQPMVEGLPVTSARCDAQVRRSRAIARDLAIPSSGTTPSASTRQCYGAVNETYRFQHVELCHYGIAQRWLVIYSEAAFRRAERKACRRNVGIAPRKTLEKARNKEYQKVQKQLFHLQAQRFDSPEDARAALDKMSSALNYHAVVQSSVHQKIQYAKRGRPTADTPIKARKWQIIAQVAPNWDKIKAQQQRKGCFVLSTNIPEADLTDRDVFSGYKGQTAVEQGFGFLKDPLFFVSSLFVKKPSRIEGLLMVMTLALLVYSIAWRVRSHALAA